MANSRDWQIRTMRAILEVLADAPGGQLRWEQVNAPIRARWEHLFDPADIETVRNGAERWWDYAAWGGTTLVYAGALVKKNGNWSITPYGRQLLAEVTDPEQFLERVRAIAAEKRASQRPQGRRAWLVRGGTGRTNLLATWLSEGWCSIGASQLPDIGPGIDAPDLERLAKESYGHLPHQSSK